MIELTNLEQRIKELHIEHGDGPLFVCAPTTNRLSFVDGCGREIAGLDIPQVSQAELYARKLKQEAESRRPAPWKGNK